MCLEPTVQLLCSAFSVYSVLSVQNVYTAHQNYPFFKFQLPTKIQSFHYEGLEGPLLEIMQSGITTTDFKNHEPLNNDLITPSVFHVFPYCLLFICYLEYGRIFTLLNLKRKKRLSTLLSEGFHCKTLPVPWAMLSHPLRLHTALPAVQAKPPEGSSGRDQPLQPLGPSAIRRSAAHMHGQGNEASL